jgi:hypothetical protein
MIILDYSQVALSNILSFQRDLQKNMATDKTDEAVNIIRHAVLSSIKYYKKKYGKEYGQIVIACDGRQYWRKEHFAYYKGSRKKNREKSDLDWGMIFDTLSSIRNDLAEHFPYKVVHIDRCEADDVIAALAKWSQTNELVTEGLYEEPQKVLIVSSDKDFKQLHKYSNVKQWSPMQKKYVESPKGDEYLIEHIVRGDSGDGIPNIFSKDDVFMNDEDRQTAVTAKKMAKFQELRIDACENEEQKRNWHRNQLLVDFEFIPEDVRQSVIDNYVGTTPKGNKMSIYNYFIKHKCRMLLDEIEEF